MQTNPTTNESMKRGEFLRSLGLSSAALMAFYCMGTTLTSCSGGGDDPTPAPGATTGVDFTLDLSTTANQKLKTDGEYVYQGDVIVARVKGGSYVALSKVCTHQGTSVQYRLTQDDFWCPNHGSEYAKTGAVEVGPANGPLTLYKVTPSADGNSLRVTTA